ncbi:MAG: YecA family protein [Thiohalomonadaceae bacterium]
MSDTPNDTGALVDAALRRLDAEMSAAECHGVLAGWLCAAHGLTREQWLGHVAPDLAAGDVLAQEAAATLEGLRQAVVAQLNDSMLDFQPLLPGDEQPLAERVAALGEWCQGFLLGMSLGGLKDVTKMPGDSGEALRDLVQLSRAGSYEVGDSEEDEEAYTELLEYVRTAVLLVNEELNPTRAAPQTDPTLH